MADQFGVIVGIDRANRQVGAILDDGLVAGLPDGLPYLGDPPPPLSRAWFIETAPGVYICEGSRGDQRVVLHDDFLVVVVDGSTRITAGETAWTSTSSGAGTQAILITESDTHGAVKSTTGATAGNYNGFRKDDLGSLPPVLPAALWFSARVMFGTTS